MRRERLPPSETVRLAVIAHKMGKYDDIISLPHHVSKTRSPMPVGARAAQFASFAALSGFDEMIEERSREGEEQSAEDNQADFDE